MASTRTTDFDLCLDCAPAIAIPSRAPREVSGIDPGSSVIGFGAFAMRRSGTLVERLCLRIDGYFDGVGFLRMLLGNTRPAGEVFRLRRGGNGLSKSMN